MPLFAIVSLLSAFFSSAANAQQLEVLEAYRQWIQPPLGALEKHETCPAEAPAKNAQTAGFRKFTTGGMPLSNAIASSAVEMAANHENIKYASGNASNQRFNPAFWDATSPPGTFSVRLRDDDGNEISPSEAVQDILQHPSEYKIECATATKFIYYLAFIKHLGSARFDKAVHARRSEQSPGGLYIGAGAYESILQEVMKRETESDKPANEFPGMADKDMVQLLQPGDAIYMINLKAKPSEVKIMDMLTADVKTVVDHGESVRQRGLGGENMLYLGNNLFYADGIPNKALVTAEDVQNTLTEVWDSTPGPATAPGTAEAGQQNQAPWFVNEYYHPSVDALDRLDSP